MRFSTAIAGALCALEVTALRLQPRNLGEVEALIRPARSQRSIAKRADDDEFDLTLLYPERNISVPVDFFKNESRYEPHSNDSFDLRYWFDASYYKPGGPVFVLLGGETDGEGRLPFLQKGIVHQVIKATGGVGVILEHRYYGKSFPTPDLTTENLRFLSTEQSLAEIDYFARNVQFEGIDDDLTAPNTPWIVYGGSYAGAQAAFMRLVYPETFWGAISSSGVTVAIIDYWEYMEPARLFAAPDCVKATQTFVDVFDGIVLNEANADKVQSLKEVFGADNFTDTRDLAFQLTYMSLLQSTNWDPAIDYSGLYDFCNNMTSEEPINEDLRDKVADLVSAAGWEDDSYAQNVTLNMAAYFNLTTLESWRGSNLTQDQYFSQVNGTQWKQYTDLENYGYTSWNYQVCTEWGYFQTGNTPPEIMPLYSRILDVEYLSFFCGAQFNLTSPPDVWQVNKYGNYTVDYPRLAHLGGNADVWRPATPLWYPDHKESTTSEPWLLISHGVHHWEENGIFPNETTPETPPAQVVYAQQFLKNFVIDWLDEFADQKQRSEL